MLDADVAAVIAAAAEAGGLVLVTPRGDAIALRGVVNTTLQLMDSAEPDSPNVLTADHLVPVADGDIRVRWYTSKRLAAGSAVVYCHGGGPRREHPVRAQPGPRGCVHRVVCRPGCPHAFDRAAPAAGVSACSWADRYRAIKAV